MLKIIFDNVEHVEVAAGWCVNNESDRWLIDDSCLIVSGKYNTPSKQSEALLSSSTSSDGVHTPATYLIECINSLKTVTRTYIHSVLVHRGATMEFGFTPLLFTLHCDYFWFQTLFLILSGTQFGQALHIMFTVGKMYNIMRIVIDFAHNVTLRMMYTILHTVSPYIILWYDLYTMIYSSTIFFCSQCIHVNDVAMVLVFVAMVEAVLVWCQWWFEWR